MALLTSHFESQTHTQSRQLSSGPQLQRVRTNSRPEGIRGQPNPIPCRSVTAGSLRSPQCQSSVNRPCFLYELCCALR
jgi:hypothetical protein